MRKKSDKEEIIVDVDDSTEQENRDLRKNNTKKGSSKDSVKLLVAFFLLFVLTLMGIVHAHFGAILVVGITLGVMIKLIDREKYK